MNFDKDEINSKSIIDYLKQSGMSPHRESGKWVFFYSPFRTEGTASLAVDKYKNRWRDFGESGKSQDLISLVMKLEHLDFVGACEFITGSKKISFEPYSIPTKQNKEDIIVEVGDWKTQSVIEYATQIRKIDRSVLYRYCKQVWFSFPNGVLKDGRPKKHVGIGFPNDGGGWDIRNSFFKVACQPKTVSTIKGRSPDGTTNVFEGFMNYLSALTYFNKLQFDNDTIVMNGAGQIETLIESVNGKTVLYYGDNDPTGNKLLIRLKEEVEVEDLRGLYEWYNDFNLFICEQ